MFKIGDKVTIVANESDGFKGFISGLINNPIVKIETHRGVYKFTGFWGTTLKGTIKEVLPHNHYVIESKIGENHLFTNDYKEMRYHNE